MELDLTNLPFYLLWLLSYGILSTKAALRNVTIDDSTGDEFTHIVPKYLPTAETNPIGTSSPWAGPNCGGAIQPDLKQAYGGTCHAATYHPEIDSISIEFSFTGTAVYVYFIIPHTIPFVTTDAACNFTLDGNRVGTFFRNPTDPNALIYNFLAFSQTGLTNSGHTLKIETGNGYSHDAFLAFDYATYTFDDANGPPPIPSSTTTSSSSTQTRTSTTGGGAAIPTNTSPSDNGDKKGVNVAAIAGGVVGGVGALVLLALLFLLLSRRKRKNTSAEAGMAPSSFYYTDYSTGPTPTTTGAPQHRDIKTRASMAPGAPSPGAGDGLYPNRRTLPVPPAPSSTAGTSASISGLGSTTLTNTDEKASLRTAQTADELKRARQRELQRQLQAVKAEMRALQADLQETQGGVGAERHISVRSQRAEGGNDQEVVRLREQIRVMSEQMETLRLQQDSAWAQGLSDEPPPGYTAHPTNS